MDKLNEILRELGISKVKLAKFLGVSRQMIYNYLELDSINKWPKDKKVLLLNLLGAKSAEEIDKIKVTTDYIYEVDARLKSVTTISNKGSNDNLYEGLGKKQKVLLQDIFEAVKEKLEDENDLEGYNTMLYLYHFLQSMDTSKELKYMLGYISKATGFTKPMEFVFDEEEQFLFESILFSAFSLYNGGGASKTKIAAAHERFVAQIEHKIEEKMSRTMELNTFKVQALKELGYTEINETNAAEVLEKMAEIQSRKVTN
ncbi:MAG: hypothetical protein E7170_04275 [Firmicutes bacterium]|nr:hypothetical protein [Bacillota bacterium]